MEHEHTTPEPSIPSADETREHAEALASIVGAAGIETLPPPVDFRTDAPAWIAEHIGIEGGKALRARERAFASLSALLEPYGADPTSTERDAVALARVLSQALALLEYHIREDSRFVRFGGLLLPTTPSALSVLRVLRKVAAERIHGNGLAETVEPESALGVFLAAIERASREERSPLLLSARNRTNAEPGQGFRIGFDFHARALASMPCGEALPSALLSPDPVGFYIDDPRDMQRDCNMCDVGTADFLSQFGIVFELSGGSYECGECGTEHESEESGEIESIDGFEISADMWSAIERRGFGDAVREYIGAQSERDSLSALLSNESEAETLERVAPDPERGIRFDPSVWDFRPDFESVEGADEIEGAEALRAGALLLRVVDAHTSAGVLPPIGGTLHYRPLPYETRHIGDGIESTRPHGIAFAWDPDSGTLEHTLRGGLVLRIDARKGSRVLVLRTLSEPTVPLVAEEGEWIADAHHESAGEVAGLLLRIAKGRAEI